MTSKITTKELEKESKRMEKAIADAGGKETIDEAQKLCNQAEKEIKEMGGVQAIVRIQEEAAKAQKYEQEHDAFTNAEETRHADAASDNGEITEAKVLALIERLANVVDTTDELIAKISPLDPDKAEIDEYRDGVIGNNAIIKNVLDTKRFIIQNLNATANRMLDYLEKKRNAGARDEANADIAEILKLCENPAFDDESKDSFKTLIYEYYVDRLHHAGEAE